MKVRRIAYKSVGSDIEYIDKMADVPEIKKVWYWKHWLGVILQDMELIPVMCFSACYDRVWKYGYVVSISR